MRRASESEQTDAAAIAAVKQHFIAIGWGPVENKPHDLGTDLLVWVRDARLWDLGLLVGAQVKGGPHWFKRPKQEDGELVGWWYREDDRSHFDAWASSAIPHLLVLHDLDDDTSYWVAITPEKIIDTGRGAKIFVPRTNTLDPEHLGELIEIATAGRPRVSWEGSAWTSAIEIPAEARYRFALIVPRLIAPHPNAGAAGGLDQAGAIALATQARLRDLERLCEEVEEAPALGEAEHSPDWGWRFAAALARYVLHGEPDPLLACAAEAPDPAGRATGAIAAACALLDLAHPEDALALIEAALARDDAAPVDHAWLCMQRARIWAELGRLDDARDGALKLLAIGRFAGEDVTATAIAGAAAALVLSTSAPTEEALRGAIAGGDTAAGWWRSQLLAWGLGELLERDFVAWSQDRSVTFGAEDTAARHLIAASLTANHLGDQGGWRYARGLLARQSLVSLTRQAEPDEVCSALERLRSAGDNKAVKLTARKLATDGPAGALRIAGSGLDLGRSTRTTALADLGLLEGAGDLLDVADAERHLAWLLVTLADPAAFRERTAPTFLVEHQLLETLAAVVPAAGPGGIGAVIDTVLALEPQEEQLLATSWAKVVVAIPEPAWTEEKARTAGECADRHHFPLDDALLSVAARVDLVVRERLLREAKEGSTRALGALGNVRDLPSEVAAGMIHKLAASVTEQVEQARAGTHGIGDDVARDLALMNLWHPEDARWEPLFVQLSEPAVLVEQKRGAVVLLGAMSDRIPDGPRSRLSDLAAELSRAEVPGPSFFGEGQSLRGAAVKLAIALGSLAEEESREHLLDLLGGASRERLWVAHAVATRGDPAESPLLIGLLQDNEPEVRATAAAALAQLLARGRADDLSIRALRRALSDPGTWVGLSVARTIDVEEDAGSAIGELWAELRDHPSAEVRRLAAAADGQV